MGNRKVLGLLLILIGALFLLNQLGIFNANIFFDGWWTLFLIVPAIMSMNKQGLTTGNTVLLIIGVVLLLSEQGLDFKGYLVPAVLIAIGVSIFIRK
jgi:hypothetical protein